MATVGYTSAIVSGVPTVRWDDFSTGDTATAVPIQGQQGLAGSVQFAGTFGGATVILQVSNDNSAFVTAKDVNGTSISSTAAALWEFSTSAAYVRPSISGGAGDDVDVILTLRG